MSILPILACWIAAFIIGYLPTFGWNAGENLENCYWDEKIPPNYLIFFQVLSIFIPLIVIPLINFYIVYKVKKVILTNHECLLSNN
jgi:hypothetical protein